MCTYSLACLLLVCLSSDPFFVKRHLGSNASEQRAGMAATFVVLDACARSELR